MRSRLAQERFTQSLGFIIKEPMMSDQDHRHGEDIFCPTNAVLNLLSERWTLHIVRTLLEGKKRFNDIARANDINPRTLRERLRALEEESVVTRTVVSTIPPNVEYALTPKGMALNCILEGLAEWGRTWMKPPKAPHPPVPSPSDARSSLGSEGEGGEPQRAG